MPSKQQLGTSGEIQARRYLERCGHVVAAANFRTRFGEIDLVTHDGEVLVFVEVKLRCSGRQGYPEEAVTKRKLVHTVMAAEQYRKTTRHRGLWRIDVVSIGPTGLRHLENVTA